nr:MAG TPA: hypothetical protein [Caudoviricetes sp.]
MLILILSFYRLPFYSIFLFLDFFGIKKTTG